MKNCKVISISNQKGGVSKTTACANLGIGIARQGKMVLIIDFDAQGSLTASLGYRRQDELPITITTIMGKIITDSLFDPHDGILHHAEGIDLMPANIELSGMEISLVNAMSQETVLRQYIEVVKNEYDYIFIDCQPSLGMLTINALAASDLVIIPVQAHYLSLKGFEQLLQSIARVQKHINPGLKIDGILLTMVGDRISIMSRYLYQLE